MSSAGAGDTSGGVPARGASPDAPDSLGLEARVRGWVTQLGRAWRRLLRSMLRPWRRSLHFRVMAITVLLGLLVSFALGSFMYQRIADQLVQDKLNSSAADALQRQRDAQDTLSTLTQVDNSTLYQGAKDAVERVQASDQSRRVVLDRAVDNPVPTTVPVVATGGATASDIPDDLRQALKNDPTHQQSRVVTVPTGEGGTVPAVVIGSRLKMPTATPNGGNYDLFLIYPMDQEIQTLNIVRNSFLPAGFILVALMGALAYMVTRMVVTPVRSARHVAERLAAGALNERMRVQGEDDLARLATSFNEMADGLQRQIRQLQDLSEVQQRFTSDVSHELRTPLTTIRMATELIHDNRGDLAAPVARSAELLLKELDRFESLLADLLEISRFDAGAASLELTEVDLGDVVRRVADSNGSLAERAGTPLRLHIEGDSPALMDQRRVERILRNLVSNAIEHGDGHPIDITVAANATAVAVAVRDHGVGLRPGDASMVFSRFWRADPARARTTGGTGLGLAISLEDARLHHGWLQAWGEVGQGSCFRLTLPRTEGVAIKRSPVRLVDAPVGSAADRGDLAAPRQLPSSAGTPATKAGPANQFESPPDAGRRVGS